MLPQLSSQIPKRKLSHQRKKPRSLRTKRRLPKTWTLLLSKKWRREERLWGPPTWKKRRKSRLTRIITTLLYLRVTPQGSVRHRKQWVLANKEANRRIMVFSNNTKITVLERQGIRSKSIIKVRKKTRATSTVKTIKNFLLIQQCLIPIINNITKYLLVNKTLRQPS